MKVVTYKPAQMQEVFVCCMNEWPAPVSKQTATTPVAGLPPLTELALAGLSDE